MKGMQPTHDSNHASACIMHTWRFDHGATSLAGISNDTQRCTSGTFWCLIQQQRRCNPDTTASQAVASLAKYKRQPTWQHNLCEASNKPTAATKQYKSSPTFMRLLTGSCSSSASQQRWCCMRATQQHLSTNMTTRQPGSRPAPHICCQCYVRRNINTSAHARAAACQIPWSPTVSHQQLTKVQTSAAPATGLHHLCSYSSRHHCAITVAKVKRSICCV
jgi:hypothetical protein